MAAKKVTSKQNGIQRFTRETLGELRKVSWPSRQEALNLTMVVIIVMIFMGIFLTVADLLSREMLDLVFGF